MGADGSLSVHWHGDYLTGSLQPKSLVLRWHNFKAPFKPAEQVALTHLFKMCLENVFEKQPVVCFIRALRKIVYSNTFHMTLSMVDKRFKIAFLKDYFFIDFIFLKCSETWIYENIWIVRDILCSEIKLNILKCQLRFDHIYIYFCYRFCFTFHLKKTCKDPKLRN